MICSTLWINIVARNNTKDSQFPARFSIEDTAFPAKDGLHYLLFLWTLLVIKYKQKRSVKLHKHQQSDSTACQRYLPVCLISQLQGILAFAHTHLGGVRAIH